MGEQPKPWRPGLPFKRPLTSFKNGLIETLCCSTKTNVKFCTRVRITSCNTNRLETDWLGSSFAGRGLEVLVVELSVQKQCPFVIIKANYTTGCIINSTVSRTEEVINALYLLSGGSTWSIITVLHLPAQERLSKWSKSTGQPLSQLRAWNMRCTKQLRGN